MRFAFALIAISAALFAAPALAQEAPLAKVYACADIKDSAQRLACFDGAVATLKQADAGGDVAVVSRSQVQKVEKDAFGLSVPSVAELAASVASSAPVAASSGDKPVASKPVKPEKAKPLESVSLAVKSIKKDAGGDLVFTMENGQIWKQIDTGSLGSIGKGPWTAEIKKAALGSYVISFAGSNKTVRVKRLE